jgi:signal transduction histidine kinase
VIHPDTTLEQAALRRIATLVAKGVKPQELFAVVAEEVGRVVDAPSIAVSRYEPDATATVCGTFPAQGLLFLTGTRVSLEEASVLRLIRDHAEPVRVDNHAELDGEIADGVRCSGLCSSVGVPILVAGCVWGAIVASDTERLPENTGDRLAEFTELLGAAIANSEAREALARLADEQAALRRVATLVAQDTAPAEIFAAVSAEVDRAFGLDPATFDVAVIGRFEPGPELVVVGVSKSVEVVPLGSRWPTDDLFAPTHVLQTGRSARIRVDDVLSEGGEVTEFLRRHGYLSQIASPILVDGLLWGAMSVNSRNELPGDTEERLERFTELVATAIANAESRETLAQLADEQASLRRVATLVARGAQPDEVFWAVSDEVGRLFGTHLAAVGKFEPDGDTVVFVGADRTQERLELADFSAAAEVLRTGRSARSDVARWESAAGEAAERLRRLGVVSTVASPIVVEGELWGTIRVASTDKPLPPDSEDRLENFTELVATAIANAESRDTLARLADEQASLRHVATMVAQEASPQDLFEAVAEEVGRLLPVGSSAIGRFDPDGSVTTVASWSAAEPVFPTGERWPTEGTNAAWMVFQTGRAARIDDFSAATDPIGVASREAGMKSAVGSPVVVEGHLWGVVTAASTEGPIPPGTEARLASFTELVATAIANAESHDALARLADEQAALRRIATFVAQGVPPDAIFSAVGEEVGRVFGSSIATVGRFESDPPMLVMVGVGAGGEMIPIGSRWELDLRMPSAQVFRTGHSVRVDQVDWSEIGGRVSEVGSRLRIVSTVASPIFVERRLWGVMSVSDDKRLPPDAEQRLEKFTELIATAIANAESSAELAASRRRIVGAADEARRRIERDLHDGIQQRLIALTFGARAMTRRPSDEMAAIAAGLAEGLKEASDELREVSRGIHPTILTEAGLGPALRALARRSDVPVEVDVTLDERLPAPVEAAAYYIASEALTNVAKHAHASVVELIAACGDGVLTLEVRDDGVGGVEAGRGSGILGLTDRVEALGGTISIASPHRGGTRVSVRLPTTG